MELNTVCRLGVLGVASVVGMSASVSSATGTLDDWWLCVELCCDECPACVDKCTDDYNADLGGSGVEWPRFDLTLGYDRGSETLVYEPGDEVLLRVHRWLGGDRLSGPGKVEFVQFLAVARRSVGPGMEISDAPWKLVGISTFHTWEDGWSVPLDTKEFSDPGGYYLRADFFYPGGTPSTGVNVAVMERDCAADCDGDGRLSIRDFICFQTHFAHGDRSADCTGDGKLNINDFICYQQLFKRGCP